MAALDPARPEVEMHLAGGVVMGAGQNHMFTLAAYSRPITSELQFRRFQLHFGLFRLQFGRRRRYQGGLLGGVERRAE